MRRRWRDCCEGVVSDEVARGAFRPAVREGLLYGISTTGRSCPGVGSEFVIFERTDVLFVALWCCFRFGCVRFCRLGWTLVSFLCEDVAAWSADFRSSEAHSPGRRDGSLA